MKLQNLIHILIGIVCIGLLPGAKAVVPLPDGDNTAEGQNALLSLTTDVPFTASGDVQEAWVARHDGPNNYDDVAIAVAVDGSGNVFVTGFTFDPNTDYDYTTIKYNSAGQQQWVARYDGPENYTDKATAIAVDASGNVYITGASSSNAGGLDYATIKYNSAGQRQWVARYDGPANSDDEATAIAVDRSGNVYVTGTSYGSGYSHDYATIKYNSAGQQQWVARYDGVGYDAATAIAVDGSGNVYVTGESDGSGYDSDYATIKYNSAGQQQWVARYDGPANSDDAATAIAIDGVGNICVTGYSSGSVGYDYATIKYNSAGQQQWVRRYDGPGHSTDKATAIAIDGAASVYVTGASDGSGYNSDYATIKYNSTGQQQWVARYDGPYHYTDKATAMAIDRSGSIYVTGASYGSGYDDDYATIKYNSAGQQQWVARYDGVGNYDEATGIAVDGSGNVYVTGESDGSGYNSDYATIKYSPTEPPVVATTAATNVASFSATLHGTVNPHGLTSSVYFQYGTTTGYGLTTAPQSHTGNTSLNISANISGLSASTTYHFRIVTTNSAGTRYSGDRTFTTLTATGFPVVTTNPATNVATSSAMLHGSLDPHGLTTSVYFQYGTTISYGRTTPMQSQTGNTYRTIAANISGLARHTTYHFRIVATNSVGTRYGIDRIFTTQ